MSISGTMIFILISHIRLPSYQEKMGNYYGQLAGASLCRNTSIPHESTRSAIVHRGDHEQENIPRLLV